MTSDRRNRMFGGNPNCHMCTQTIETILHTLRDCLAASRIWSQLINLVHILEFFRAPFETWIRWNLTVEAGLNSKTQWKTIFMVTCWWLWFWRNKEIFAPPFKRPPKVERIIMDYIQRLDKAFEKENLIQNVKKREILIGWSPLPEPWIKINVDGAACVTTRKAGCGGIIRNHQGR
ncbi:hypothetical protein AHAS_Ahas13G0477500 [Arachis hypogaea]